MEWNATTSAVSRQARLASGRPNADTTRPARTASGEAGADEGPRRARPTTDLMRFTALTLLLYQPSHPTSHFRAPNVPPKKSWARLRLDEHS